MAISCSNGAVSLQSICVSKINNVCVLMYRDRRRNGHVIFFTVLRRLYR